MNNKKYRIAAKRHLDTCEYMLDYLDKISYADAYSKENILIDIYYLSGYIIECIVSYAINQLNLTKSRGLEIRKIHNFPIPFDLKRFLIYRIGAGSYVLSCYLNFQNPE